MPEALEQEGQKVDLKALDTITKKVLQHQPKKQERKDSRGSTAKSSI